MGVPAVMILVCIDCFCVDCSIGVWNTTDLSQFSTTGTVAVVSAGIEMTGAAVADFIPEPALETDPVKITVNVEMLTEGVSEIVIGKEDDDNYLFARIDGGQETIQLGQILGGSETLFGDPENITLSSGETVKLCWAGGGPMTATSAAIAAFPKYVIPGSTWLNPDNVKANDGATANWTFSTSTETTPALNTAQYGLVIPPGSTIDGVSVAIEVGYPGTADMVEVTRINLVVDGLASDNLAEPRPVPATLTELTFGNATEQWGYAPGELTRDGLVDNENFGVVHQFTNNDATPDVVALVFDYTYVTVWFTTPERERGKLQVNYGGTCLTTFSAMSAGKKVGLKSLSGEWRFTGFKLDYANSLERPACPGCGCVTGDGPACPCCSPGSGAESESLESYSLDLTGSTIGDNICDCSLFSGVIIVDTSGNCEWYYFEEIECSPEVLDCPGIAQASLQRWEKPGVGCVWRASFGIAATCGSTVIQDPTNEDESVRPGNYSNLWAVYDSDGTEEGCLDLPVTLYKVAAADGGFVFGRTCTGEWPATIQLNAP